MSSSLSSDSVTQTPQWKTLDALDRGVQRGELINTSLETVSKCWPGFVIRWLSNPLAQLFGCDLLACYRVSNVAERLLSYCKENEAAFADDLLRAKAVAVVSTLGNKTKGKYNDAVNETCLAIDAIKNPQKTSTAEEPLIENVVAPEVPSTGYWPNFKNVFTFTRAVKASSTPAPAVSSSPSIQVPQVVPPVVPQIKPEELQKAMTHALHTLGDSVQKELVQQGKSTLFSSTAALNVVGALIRGAADDEVAAYKQLLSVAPSDAVDVQLKATREHLQKAGVSHALCFANHKSTKISDAFTKQLKDMFGAKIFTPSWGNSARLQANAHIKDNTGKAQISELLPAAQFEKGKNLDFALVQATSVEATLPVAAKNVVSTEFTCTNGEKKQTKLSVFETQANVYKAKGYTLVEVSYKTADDAPLSKVLVLSEDPKKPVTLSAQELQAARQQAKPQEVTLVMPQMDFEDKNFKMLETLGQIKLPVGKVADTLLSGIMTATRFKEVDGPKVQGPAPKDPPKREEIRFDRAFSFYVVQKELAVMQGLVDDERALPKA